MSVEMNFEYMGELRCKATHGPSGTELITDAPVDNMGKGESFSPTDLFTTALATCMMTIMGIQANALKIDLTGMKVRASKEMSTGRPRKISKVTVIFDIPANPGEREQGMLIKAAESCPVHHSMDHDIEQVIEYNWGTGA